MVVSVVENGTEQSPEEQSVAENEATEAAVKVNETTETETKTYDPNTEIDIKVQFLLKSLITTIFLNIEKFSINFLRIL